MVLRHIVAVLCEMRNLNKSYHDRWIAREGPTAWPPLSLDFNPLDFYLWGHLETLLHAASVDNEETLHRRIVDACQTTLGSLN
jgi:hypothetical protein